EGKLVLCQDLTLRCEHFRLSRPCRDVCASCQKRTSRAIDGLSQLSDHCSLALNFCQIQSAASTSNEPTRAATISRSEIAILSRSGSRPNKRNINPPTRAPKRPTPRFRKKPNPPRSQVIRKPVRLPPMRPTMIQTINWVSDGIATSPELETTHYRRTASRKHYENPLALDFHN